MEHVPSSCGAEHVMSHIYLVLFGYSPVLFVSSLVPGVMEHVPSSGRCGTCYVTHLSCTVFVHLKD